MMLIPQRRFTEPRAQAAVAILDLILVSATLYLLRVPNNYLFIAFLGIFVLAIVWRDLRLVLFSIFLVSLLFGLFNYFRLFNLMLLDVNIEKFLTLALFLSSRFSTSSCRTGLLQDAKTSHAMMEENRL
jgi:hypothetical protein